MNSVVATEDGGPTQVSRLCQLASVPLMLSSYSHPTFFIRFMSAGKDGEKEKGKEKDVRILSASAMVQLILNILAEKYNADAVCVKMGRPRVPLPGTMLRGGGGREEGGRKERWLVSRHHPPSSPYSSFSSSSTSPPHRVFHSLVLQLLTAVHGELCTPVQ